MRLFFSAWRTLSSAVVKLPDDPRPVPPGMSAIEVSSSERPSMRIRANASRISGCSSCEASGTRSNVVVERSDLERPGRVAAGKFPDGRLGRTHLRKHFVEDAALLTVAAAETVDGDFSVATVELEREKIFPFGAAHMEPCGLAAR